MPIGTDTYVRNFVSKTCTSPILSGHPTLVYQLAYYAYRCVLQQQHVDCKIADTLLKKGTKQHTDDLVWGFLPGSSVVVFVKG